MLLSFPSMINSRGKCDTYVDSTTYWGKPSFQFLVLFFLSNDFLFESFCKFLKSGSQPILCSWLYWSLMRLEVLIFLVFYLFAKFVNWIVPTFALLLNTDSTPRHTTFSGNNLFLALTHNATANTFALQNFGQSNLFPMWYNAWSYTLWIVIS